MLQAAKLQALTSPSQKLSGTLNWVMLAVLTILGTISCLVHLITPTPINRLQTPSASPQLDRHPFPPLFLSWALVLPSAGAAG